MPDNQPNRPAKRTFLSVPGRVALRLAIKAAAMATRIERKLDWLSPLLQRLDHWWHSTPSPDTPSRAERYEKRLNLVRAVASMLWIVRASWTIAPLLALLIILPDQTVDAMQCLSETDWSAAWWFTLLCTFACMGFAGLTLWHWGRASVDLFADTRSAPANLPFRGHAARTREPDGQHQVQPSNDICNCGMCRGRHLAGLILPRVAGLIPSIAFTLCAVRALLRAPRDGTAYWMLWALITSGLIAALLQWYCYVLRRQVLEHALPTTPRPLQPTRSLRAIDAMSRMFLGAWLLIGLVLTLGFLYVPGIAAAFGPIAILYVSAALCVSAGGLLVWVDEHIGIPTLPVLTLLAAAFSAANLNDNHGIRTIAPTAVTPTAPAPMPRLTASQAFDIWLKTRAPRQPDATEPPPVILMCAEGGGIYAATLTGMTLAHLQSITPGGITPNVFCISAVSGGSVGAAAFASLSQAGLSPNQPTANAPSPLEASVERALSNDLLSPVLAHLLFPDLIQRFLPLPIPAFDRARALERALEHAVASELPTAANPMTANVASLWSPDSQQPALLFNTTRVDTGERIVISPFDVAPSSTASLLTLSQLAPHIELRTSTAAIASARFSFVTPAATITNIHTPAGSTLSSTTTRLVDGGYFDNPGAATLLDVLNAILTRREGRPPLRVLVVRIGIAPAPGDTLNFTGLGETMSPIRAMFNTRPAHGRTSVAQLIDALTHVDPSVARTGYVELILDTQAQQIPLGWLLSSRSRSAILSQFGIRGSTTAPESVQISSAAVRNREILDAISTFAQTGRFPPPHLDATHSSDLAPAHAR